MNLVSALWSSLAATIRDVLPVAVVIVVFQWLVLRKPVPQARRVAVGFAYLVVGLAVFLVGLQTALFPLGEGIARQLADPDFVQGPRAVQPAAVVPWYRYYWSYLFAFLIAFSATLAEPGLLAVAQRAQQLSGGTLHALGLRGAVAFGSGLGAALGTLRIAAGWPLFVFMLGVALIVALQTWFAPRQLVPLAYDAGIIATSTVTVPLVTALGVGLAAQIPGRNPLVDGFGLVAMVGLVPMITVMGLGQAAQWWTARRTPG